MQSLHTFWFKRQHMFLPGSDGRQQRGLAVRCALLGNEIIQISTQAALHVVHLVLGLFCGILARATISMFTVAGTSHKQHERSLACKHSIIPS